ncbi:hypothetical protein CRYUN_Cryun04dG0130600 [Craigia yunnanensis]
MTFRPCPVLLQSTFSQIEVLLSLVDDFSHYFCRILSLAGRKHMPRHPDSFQSFCNGPQPVLTQAPGPMPFDPATWKEVVEMQHREMLRIIGENRLIIDNNTHLQREFDHCRR